MKPVLLFLCLFMIQSVTLSAEEIPGLVLKEGLNEVSLTVVNNWEADLNELGFNVDAGKIPEWLSISGNDQTITVTHNEEGIGSFRLNFTLANAPDGACVELP